ncbi:hypothetical protein VTK73DRAFT_2670 [Phialemonium thermophilum]|uniref:Transcriptional regulatory protein DEP1 n=1 Tax=Phialemonium thermophilum TaxID=223376 RepID=A0ABR3X384_9PEZI
MAAGDTAAPAAVPSSPSQLREQSPSNLSSPLSDVEDKDTDAEDMDLSSPPQNSTELGTPHQRDRERDEEGDLASAANSDDSKLSDLDMNDSEAETERLYDSPRKNTLARESANGEERSSGKQFIDRPSRNTDRSPSKLNQEVHANVNALNERSDKVRDGDNDGSDHGASAVSSENESQPPKLSNSQLRSRNKRQSVTDTSERARTPSPAKDESAERRKRKRSSITEPPDLDQPLKKRPGSVVADREVSIGDVAVPEDEAVHADARGVEHPGDDDNTGDGTAEGESEATGDNNKEVTEESTAKPSTTERSRSKKTKRNGTKPRNASIDNAGGGEASAENVLDETRSATVEEEPGQTVEDEHAEAEADEEAELAQKNEEELERKKAAWEELNAIEKQFSSFRERLYQERLEQLDQEEAMLTGDNPTHPEYLAMLRCIDERRDERIRVSKLELQFKMDTLKRKAVSERAQILSQYFQSVRESREKVLEALGKEWYEIQQKRRRFANTVPDYGFRLPRSRAESIRQAVAYNKEVSILSGLAKYRGFPAAPAILGASEEQADEDLDAIKRGKRSLHAQAAQPIHTDLGSGMPFGHNLGPAGEQFLEQTPWANPNHPFHMGQRRQIEHDPSPSAAFQAHHVPPRLPQQTGRLFSPNSYPPPTINGDSTMPTNKSRPSLSQENGRAPKVGSDANFNREALLQAS